jgi:hypothetical protein
MNFKSACVVAALAVVACMASASSEAASPVIRGRFSYDGIANCQQPPIQNFRFHAEGTATLSTDRTASLDVRSSTSGRTKLSAALGRRTEAFGGSTTLNVGGTALATCRSGLPEQYHHCDDDDPRKRLQDDDRRST